ncbi:serine/threonine protein kinase [Actinokineospora sp. 24-640]
MKIDVVLGGRFQITAPLGQGAMGKIYRAVDQISGFEVAVKVLPARFHETDTWYEEKREKLAVEGDIGKNLDGIGGTPVVYDIGVSDGQSYVVMQMIEGPSLTELLARYRSLKRRTAVAIACQLGRILDDVHRRGFVHRDVKPDNIKIDNSGRVYLLDLGIAKDVTAKNIFGGTKGYAPYEQVRDRKLTFQSDVYALGCLICEMVTNQVPFTEEDEWNVADVPAEVPPHVLHRLGPDLGDVVLQMLDRDLDRRFSSAAEVVDRLRRLLPPPDAPPDPQAPEPDPEAWLRAQFLRMPAVMD